MRPLARDAEADGPPDELAPEADPVANGVSADAADLDAAVLADELGFEDPGAGFDLDGVVHRMPESHGRDSFLRPGMPGYADTTDTGRDVVSDA